jgi:hypothetical protein
MHLQLINADTVDHQVTVTTSYALADGSPHGGSPATRDITVRRGASGSWDWDLGRPQNTDRNAKLGSCTPELRG